MPVTLLTPAGLPQTPTHQQVSVATGTRTVHVAGQVSVDEHGETVGVGNLDAQVEQVHRNLVIALDSAGATFEDVTRLTLYMVDLRPETLGPAVDALLRTRQAMGIAAAPPLTGIGVSALASPDYLLEIEATAVLP